MDSYTLPFDQINMQDVALVGGKNASLGEMYQHLTAKGILIPNGFATTANAYWHFLDSNHLRDKMISALSELDTEHFENLHRVGDWIRSMILVSKMPDDIAEDIIKSYRKLASSIPGDLQLAVRSSATAEDLPTASFAGQLESFLNIRGEKALILAVQQCYASLFTDRAIKYRFDQGFDHMKVALSVGIQQMVRSDLESSGVAFTLDPDSGFENAILISGAWGLGENVVQGTVNLDEFLVFKPTLRDGKQAIISRKLGSKEKTMVYATDGPGKSGRPVINIDTAPEKRAQYILSDSEVTRLAHWMDTIEAHYGRHMDVEWAKDGLTGELYLVQARPETVHSSRKEKYMLYSYHLEQKSKVLVQGIALGNRIASGKARILYHPSEAAKLQAGEVLVTDATNPDWDPIMKKAAAIVTNRGGRTSHAAIVARELGAVAIVGAADATEKIHDGDEVTLSCAEGNVGRVYEGLLSWKQEAIDLRTLPTPARTQPMLILGEPEKAFTYSFLPQQGVGLMRLEFVINNAICIHPMALVKYDSLQDKVAKREIARRTAGYEEKTDFFVDKLSQAVATIAAAFYPHDVIVRMSDFKSNEYANLIGGREFEPEEENPMIGFRGASRYYHPLYREGFGLECRTMRKVRDEMGFSNVKLMIPFCRTVEEGEKVVALMAEHGLIQGENDLEIYVMVELPSNVMEAEGFARVFDGFSIGSNDLTQLTLGLDRDSELVSDLFDENNPAVKRMIHEAIQVAGKSGIKIGLCGQAPSDFPEFAGFLVKAGIDSISFQADALIAGIENIVKAEQALSMTKVKEEDDKSHRRHIMNS